MQQQRNDLEVQKRFADHSRTAWGFTYFVRRHDLIKIGHSGAPAIRIGKLGQPREVLAIISNTFIDEPTAHKMFAHLRVDGEWFRAEPDLMAFIEDVKVSATELPANLAKLISSTADEFGHRCSNLIELLENYGKAEGETQRAHIEANIRKQMADLAIRHQ